MLFHLCYHNELEMIRDIRIINNRQINYQEEEEDSQAVVQTHLNAAAPQVTLPWKWGT